MEDIETYYINVFSVMVDIIYAAPLPAFQAS